MLQRLLYKVGKKAVSGPLILLYHRVADTSIDPLRLCVTPEHFVEHLEILQKYRRPMRLTQLVKALHNGSSLRNAVVVTFDDGYADNYYNVKPLLERFDIPATIFVVTGYIDQSREFWWGELEQLLLHRGERLPSKLFINVGGRGYQWKLIYRFLNRFLRPLSQEKRRYILDRLWGWSGKDFKLRNVYRCLCSDELLKLSEGGLIDIGAHTVTHPVLAALRPAIQRIEIEASRAYLESTLGRSVASFAYPYGEHYDYTAETVKIVRQVGFNCACSILVRAMGPYTDPFQLPRIPVINWDGEEFARRLAIYSSS